MLKQNPKNVKLVYKFLPLVRIHKFAMQASIAALAAAKQGKFWQMHDALFANQRQFSNAKFDQLAKQIGLNLTEFKKDEKDPRIRMLIDRDIIEARRNGVRGTPTIYINNRLLRNRSLGGVQAMIDEALQRIKKKK